MDSPDQVYLLPLTDDGSPDLPRGYVYLPPPTSPRYRLRFVLEGSSAICNKGTLWMNIPEDGKAFDPAAFRGFEYVHFSCSVVWCGVDLVLRMIDSVQTSTGISRLTSPLPVPAPLRSTRLTRPYLTSLSPSLHRLRQRRRLLTTSTWRLD